MGQCKYCNNEFKRVASHINHCPSRPKGDNKKENKDTPNMTPCPHCKKMFKRVAGHIYRCPERPEDEEISDEKTVKNDSSLKESDINGDTLNMTPCPHCKKMFKRVAGHIYRCPERPEDEEISDEETDKNDSSLKESDINGDTPNMTPCPHCKKMFKRVAGHIYRCPERPEDEEISDEETDKNDSSLKESDINGDTPNMTPCPHCKKMFKRVAGHIYRCPERPEDEEISDEETVKNDSSLKESDINGDTPNMTPCPHCKKMFKCVASHIYRCPERPEDEEISDEEMVKNDSSLKESDVNEETSNMTPCPHCKKMFKHVAGHNCPLQSDIKEKRVFDYPTNQYLYKTKINLDQSEHRTNFSVISTLKSPTKPQRPESEDGYADKLLRPPLHEDYLTSSPKQKSPSSIYSDRTKPTLCSFSAKSYGSYKSKPVSYSQATPGNLKRPPIHGDHSLYEESIDGSLTDFEDDNSFYRSSESEDSFSYLQQDLKRPPIHKGKSPSEGDKKLQFLSDKEFFEFSHHVLRE